MKKRQTTVNSCPNNRNAIKFDLSIPQTQVFEILTENFSMRRVHVLVPPTWSKKQKGNVQAICQDFLHRVNEYFDFLDLIPPTLPTLKGKHHGGEAIQH